MGSDQTEAVLFQIFRTHAEHDYALIAVHKIFFVARFEFVAEAIFRKACFLCRLRRNGASLAFRLGFVKKLFIVLGKREYFLFFFLRGNLVIVLFLIGELFLQLLPFALFRHIHAPVIF